MQRVTPDQAGLDFQQSLCVKVGGVTAFLPGHGAVVKQGFAGIAHGLLDMLFQLILRGLFSFNFRFQFQHTGKGNAHGRVLPEVDSFTCFPVTASWCCTWSGRHDSSLSHTPLRTVRASFPAYGSSLSKPAFANRLHHLETIGMNLVATVRMHHREMGTPILSTFDSPESAMDMPSRLL